MKLRRINNWKQPGSRYLMGLGSASMMLQLASASCETILRRASLMARGECAPAEYRRMVTEKADAMQRSTAALLTGKGQQAVLAPFLVRARANAKRLRRGA